MKQKMLSFLLVLTVLAVMCIPAFADSENWDFTMKYREVNGKNNNEIHKLSKGTMEIDGSMWVYKKGSGHTPTPAKVYVYVYEDVSGKDRKVGSFTVQPYSTLDKAKSFSKDFGKQTAGDYYLIFAKSQDDYNDIKGEGKLKTN
ncbi:hypothetical protein [Wukongibacter sp. M2B1]|uniref:hypothetical protein n=1 Tax=Wukongibacter sp. M2B1 TaxID=3088895 RepID=UPI003D7A2598